MGPLLKAIHGLGKVQLRSVPVYVLFNKVSTHRNVKSVSDALEFMRNTSCRLGQADYSNT